MDLRHLSKRLFLLKGENGGKPLKWILSGVLLRSGIKKTVCRQSASGKMQRSRKPAGIYDWLIDLLVATNLE
jgi:hypothetical protein